MRVNDDLNPFVNKNNVQALILAGGQSRRLDGIDKGLLEVQQQPLIRHVVNTLNQQLSSVCVSANRSLTAYKQFAPTVVLDETPDFPGPLAGIAAFSEVATSPWIAIVACDLIFLPDDWVNRLLSTALSTTRRVVCASDKASGKHALCAIARRECLASASVLLRSGRHRWVDWLEHNEAGTELFDTELLFNINTPEDAKKAKILFKNKS